MLPKFCISGTIWLSLYFARNPFIGSSWSTCKTYVFAGPKILHVKFPGCSQGNARPEICACTTFSMANRFRVGGGWRDVQKPQCISQYWLQGGPPTSYNSISRGCNPRYPLVISIILLITGAHLVISNHQQPAIGWYLDDLFLTTWWW